MVDRRRLPNSNADSNRRARTRLPPASPGQFAQVTDVAGQSRTARTGLTSGGSLVRTQPCPLGNGGRPEHRAPPELRHRPRESRTVGVRIQCNATPSAYLDAVAVAGRQMTECL